MDDKTQKRQDYIPGIHCDVENCIYNDKNNNCFANEIKVGPDRATNCVDTECATFKKE